MALALYDNPMSSNALKARFGLAELGLPYERRTVPMSKPRPAAYLELNPLGGIPTLVDGDLVLTESHSILRYLARRERSEDLYPTSVREQARVDEFLDRWQAGLRSAIFRHEALALGHTPERGFDAVARDPAAAKGVETELQPTLTLLEAIIGNEAVVLGRFTIADCALAPVLYRTTHTGLNLESYPRLRGLRSTLLARPTWAAAEPVL